MAFGEKAFNELKAQKLLARLINKKGDDFDMRRAEGIIARNKKYAVNAVIALSNYSTSHTRFRDLLTVICKTRYVSMPLFDAAMLEGAMNVNWGTIDRRTRSIARIVNKAEAVEIKTPNGTSISFSKKAGRQNQTQGFSQRREHLEIFRQARYILRRWKARQTEGLSLSLRQRDS